MPRLLLCTTLALIACTRLTSAEDPPADAEFAEPGLIKRLDIEAGPVVPTIKHLDPDWIAQLPKRGTMTEYRGHDLDYIGMPIGGFTCGQIYLSGDGRLYLWDIFNQKRYTGWDHYVSPMKTDSSLAQGFSLLVHTASGVQIHALDRSGFAQVSFHGPYPVGHVEYSDPNCPIKVALDAFSPFIPLDADDSSLPLTVMRFTVTNTSAATVTADLGGWLENQVSGFEGQKYGGTRLNRIERGSRITFIQGSTSPNVSTLKENPRPSVLFEDFEGDTYAPWISEGNAFGSKPAQGAPGALQHLVGYHGHGLANSWNLTDEATGTLTSPIFTIERNRINFLIAGGNHPGETCINLAVDGKIVRSVTGNDSDTMEPGTMDVSAFAGQSGQLQIVDHTTGGWGHIDIDDITFSDQVPTTTELVDQPDFGTMGLGLLHPQPDDWAQCVDCEGGKQLFAAYEQDTSPAAQVQRTIHDKMVSGLVRPLTLKASELRTVSFVIAWSFPNLRDPGNGQYYALRFPTALKAAGYLADHEAKLTDTTLQWRDTWYDSSLPYWFLDRTFDNISTLATSTAHRFGNGNLWGWEGVGNCDGTCTHVWSYEQAMGRLFPELDINLRERTDYNPGHAFKPDGEIANRGSHEDAAIDGQAGTIMRTYRDHLMSPDNAFLLRNWPHIKLAELWLMAQDVDGNGILKNNQRNTLDAQWFGEVAWLSGLYLASLHASEAMATVAGDTAFAEKCHAIYTTGSTTFVKHLFNGEYFQNNVDPQHPESINSGSGCEIDQLYGQSWAYQDGLGPILPLEQTRTALRSLWRYNFTTDAGFYRKTNKPGRIYAVDGESGLLMATFPKPDWNYTKAHGKGEDWAAGYFNECMNGFEHEVAGNMIWEGLVVEGLAVERAVHDRYGASKRNPFNEMECGEHYARSMASYGVFIAACGFTYDGPKGAIGFDPRLTTADFKAAFTAAEGWGSYSQKIEGHAMDATYAVLYGRLRLKTVTLVPHLAGITKVTVTLNGDLVPAALQMAGGIAIVSILQEVLIPKGQTLAIALR